MPVRAAPAAAVVSRARRLGWNGLSERTERLGMAHLSEGMARPFNTRASADGVEAT